MARVKKRVSKRRSRKVSRKKTSKRRSRRQSRKLSKKHSRRKNRISKKRRSRKKTNTHLKRRSRNKQNMKGSGVSNYVDLSRRFVTDVIPQGQLRQLGKIGKFVGDVVRDNVPLLRSPDLELGVLQHQWTDQQLKKKQFNTAIGCDGSTRKLRLKCIPGTRARAKKFTEWKGEQEKMRRVAEAIIISKQAEKEWADVVKKYFKIKSKLTLVPPTWYDKSGIWAVTSPAPQNPESLHRNRNERIQLRQQWNNELDAEKILKEGQLDAEKILKEGQLAITQDEHKDATEAVNKFVNQVSELQIQSDKPFTWREQLLDKYHWNTVFTSPAWLSIPVQIQQEIIELYTESVDELIRSYKNLPHHPSEADFDKPERLPHHPTDADFDKSEPLPPYPRIQPEYLKEIKHSPEKKDNLITLASEMKSKYETAKKYTAQRPQTVT
jgi:hypothetical protein